MTGELWASCLSLVGVALGGGLTAFTTNLWTADRSVVLLCDATLEAPARAYGRALNQAVWREIGGTEINEYLEDHKSAFMAVARAALTVR